MPALVPVATPRVASASRTSRWRRATKPTLAAKVERTVSPRSASAIEAACANVSGGRRPRHSPLWLYAKWTARPGGSPAATPNDPMTCAVEAPRGRSALALMNPAARPHGIASPRDSAIASAYTARPSVSSKTTCAPGHLCSTHWRISPSSSCGTSAPVPSGFGTSTTPTSRPSRSAASKPSFTAAAAPRSKHSARTTTGMSSSASASMSAPAAVCGATTTTAASRPRGWHACAARTAASARASPDRTPTSDSEPASTHESSHGAPIPASRNSAASSSSNTRPDGPGAGSCSSIWSALHSEARSSAAPCSSTRAVATERVSVAS
mmetsp:Transcript_29366/g.95695  ORF Transcript_29366/g.95695 Transcript_29366/m.95695 type:complete len:324 (-) Transcript_29366:105-1076(-)